MGLFPQMGMGSQLQPRDGWLSGKICFTWVYAGVFPGLFMPSSGLSNSFFPAHSSSSSQASVPLTRDSEEALKKAKKSQTGGLAFEYAHKAAALGLLYVANKGLYRVCASASIKFPSPLIGAPYL